MNYLFLLNAIILCGLGVSLYLIKRDRLSASLLIFNIGLSVWNVLVFLIQAFPYQVNIDLVARLQLLASMIFVNGLYYFCSSYPYARRNKYNVLNVLAFCLLGAAILFTSKVTDARLEAGNVLYVDHPVGFTLYGLYILVLGVSTLYFLYASYRQYPQFRANIKYLLLGLSLFALFGIGCNVVLPLFGEYRFLILGRLSGIFPALFFAYVIAKHEFLDINVIINRRAAWLVTIALMSLSFALVHSLSPNNALLDLPLMTLVGVFWAVLAHRVQNFLLTSAKRKFVRGWYDTEDVITSLSHKITSEKNREAIFSTLENVLDDVFQLEQSKTYVAVRDEEQNFTHFDCLVKQGKKVWKEKVSRPAGVVSRFKENSLMPCYLDDCEKVIQDSLIQQGFKPGRQCVLLPFYSPEHLEGIIILGDRSNQAAYNERDLKFFNRLVSYMSAILYRLTPFEKLEKHYFDNKQKLHDAEIQLIRAQKIESIVHATRQCHHEIRTPLNIIRLGIGRIKNLEDLDAYKKIANEEISRALEIIEETLTITDVTKASRERYSRFNVNEVLQRCGRLVDQNRYNLVLELGEVPPVHGSFSDIQVVVTNLIHNALDAMPDGGMLSLNSFASASWVVVEVEDSGPGIEESLRSRVWEPYFSGQQTEVGNSTAGRGWGLTIVNRIITEHQGTINFTSELGQGTRFTIALPAEHGALEEHSNGDSKVVELEARRMG